MLRLSRWFSLMFATGAALFALTVGVCRSTEGVFLCSQPFMVNLRATGLGLMASGFGMWITRCRAFAGKPDLNPLLNLSLVSGDVLLLVALVSVNSPLNRLMMWAGLWLSGGGLLLSLSAMIIDPAFHCRFAKTWPDDSQYFFEPNLDDETIASKRYAIDPDDLTRIEGIGPRIQGIFKRAGVVSYAQMARISPDDLRSILVENHLHAPIDTTTWPEQARLAAKGYWKRLKQWQHELHGGRLNT